MKSVWNSLMVAVSFYSMVVTVMILVASPRETAATIFQPNQTTANLTVLARVSYPSSDSSPRCDYLHQPCAPLNDCWGTTLQSKQYAFVGLSNGIDFLDVTDPERPRKTADDAFIAGCITEWRDIKSYKEAVYVVNDDTAYCSCAQQPCQFQLNLTGLPEPSAPVPAVLAKFGLQLSASSATIEGRVVWPASADLSYGCTNDTWTGNPLAVAPWIALVDRGVCGMAEKVRQAQSAGAAGVIIISYRDDSIPPSMNGNSTGINVPAALIAHSHGQVIRSQLDAGVVVTAQFSGNNFVYNPEFQAPEGLWVINFSNPAKPVLVNKHTEWFGSAHNILIDPNPSRPYLYACGMNTANGGLMVFDVSSPLQPRLIGTWNTAYFHDVEVAFRHDLGKYVLFGTAIYNGQVYMLNVNSPRDGDWLNTITVWTTPDWPHNTASTPDGKTLYVSHEDFAMSISIWSVENLNAITTVGEINIQADQRTIPHNVYIRGQHLWASYYVSGVVVFDIKDPHNPVLLAGSNAMVDPTYPAGSGYHGVWGIYPLPKGSITYASDIETGFYTLELELPAPPPADSGISGVGVFVVILVIILVGVGLFFVWRYIKNKKIDFSVASFHSPFDSSSKKGDRLALDDDEDEDPLFKEEII